jgi:hypothetical protein
VPQADSCAAAKNVRISVIKKKPHAFQQERAAAFFDALDQLCGAASVSMSCNRLSASAAFNV